MNTNHPSFIPKWATLLKKNGGLGSLPECEVHGIQPESEVPRLPTRVLPVGGGDSLSAQSTIEIISLNQKMMQFAGIELAFGSQGSSDLRRMSADLRKLTKVRVEPFLSGSFVIPCVLESETVEVLTSTGKHRRFSGHDVLNRFTEDLQKLHDDSVTDVSNGMLQTLSALNPVLTRDAERIEYHPNGDFAKRISVTKEYIIKVGGFFDRRIDPVSYTESIKGYVTAVNLLKRSFTLKMPDGNTVDGMFTEFIRDAAREMLGETVEIIGEIEHRSNTPQYVVAYRILILDSP